MIIIYSFYIPYALQQSVDMSLFNLFFLLSNFAGFPFTLIWSFMTNFYDFFSQTFLTSINMTSELVKKTSESNTLSWLVYWEAILYNNDVHSRTSK